MPTQKPRQRAGLLRARGQGVHEAESLAARFTTDSTRLQACYQSWRVPRAIRR